MVGVSGSGAGGGCEGINDSYIYTLYMVNTLVNTIHELFECKC